MIFGLREKHAFLMYVCDTKTRRTGLYEVGRASGRSLSTSLPHCSMYMLNYARVLSCVPVFASLHTSLGAQAQRLNKHNSNVLFTYDHGG